MDKRAIVVALFLWTLGLFIGYNMGTEDFKKKAVNDGYALYDSKTREWHWKNGQAPSK